MEDGRDARFYKRRSYKFTNEWLVRACSMPYNATAELWPLPISPPIVLPEPSRGKSIETELNEKLAARL
jgi:hypothetical protein